ncbi:outer membrane protein assembly factor BamA [Hymenobacter luteus]|uniref:Outer membrane protein assembly factor BamA n=2 Tax=Hymenobacter TaxID=89966 RepID=A0A7W9SYB9_9BACT|nr:BamA/TamA family outer membrane protein [Hymenobacter luteus]MBB4599523.1 outer membrane protein assembly factor BamA [Hymenobacter latericoloratus]MBB6058167.1 outer membrane protein assembly factor BamA [Hymenobacter luteus]
MLFTLRPGRTAGAQPTAPLNPAAPPLQSASPALLPDSTRRTPPAPVLRPARPVVLQLLTEAADRPLLRPYRYRTTLPDSLAALREVRTLVLALQADAYLTASADEIRWRRDTLRVQLYVGEKFRWARLRNGNLGDGLLTRAGYREKLFREQPLQPQEWARLQQNILREAENQGYPFATIGLDSVALRGADVEGRIVLRRGPAVVFDSLQIVGKTKTRARFLTKYLQLEPNQPFSQQRVQEAARRLRQLPYLQLKAEPEVRFARGRARVYFLLEDRTSNQFDAIVGVLPNPNPGIGQKRIQLTGDVTINLRNIGGGGKGLGVQWRKLDANSQLLDAQYVHPAFLGTPLELDGSFNLLKQDTLFLTSRPRLQLAYPLANAGRLSFFVEWRNSRLLTTDTTLRQLPVNVDSRFTSYGLAYTWSTLDDPYLPRRGLLATGQGSIGTKRISKNANLNEALYEGLALRSTQVSLGLRVEQYFRVGRSGVLLARLRGEALVNERLFLNDLFRVGGLATLRGFNELNYYASQYAVGTAEFRQFTGPDAYVFLFVDQGYLRRDLPTDTLPHDTPTGLGAGLSFRTGAGQFQFVYALGRDQQQKFALNAGKIHFGITSRF